MGALHPDLWQQLRHHPTQQAYLNSQYRFNIVPAGRRSGKTAIAKRRLIKRALNATTSWEPRFFAGAPTRDQAKRIFWNDLKAMFPAEFMSRTPSESDLFIRLVNGAEVWVVGMDKPERIEGSPWDGGVLDESANMKPTAWEANVRPALSDRNGWCDLIGVPEGRNHYYKLDQAAKAMMKALGSASEWASFHWKSSEILSAHQIESAQRDMDPLLYDQEYNASFLNFSGRAYYPFLADTHTAPLAYDPRGMLVFCFDFNVDPGVAAVIQEQKLPGQFAVGPGRARLLNQPIVATGVIGEVWIPRNSNTPAVCRKLIADWGKHAGGVICYGDPSGGARGSAKVAGSDWDLIKQELRPTFGDRISYRVKPANPAQRACVNATNSRLKNTLGEIRLMVDPLKAPHVVDDFEGVALLKGGSGELDKRPGPLTHISDAISYYLEYEFPVQQKGMIEMALSGI